MGKERLLCVFQAREAEFGVWDKLIRLLRVKGLNKIFLYSDEYAAWI
jgi:hypothetical protein